MKLRKRNVLLLLVATMMFGLASITPASSQTSASTSTLTDGVLRLQLGATDHFKWQTPPGANNGDTITQTIGSGASCGLTLDSPDPAGANIVGFSPTPTNANVGFVSDAIGVRGAGEGTGQPCGRIDGNQKLTLDLLSRIAPTTGSTKRAADFAELDIEGKFGAVFTITGSLGASTYSETYDSSGPDSGPDSADGDNFRTRFPSAGRFLFNRLVFSVSSGAISLEGGADGTPACSTAEGGDCELTGSLGQTLGGTRDSLIHVVQYDRTLNCGLSETQTGEGEPTNTLERVNNETGACTAVPIDLDASVVGSQQLVSLRKDLMGQAAQFFWSVTWTPEDKTLPVKVTQFDFGDGVYRDIQWCLADDGDGDAYPELPPTASTADPAGAKDPWCLTSQHADEDQDLGAGYNFTGKISVKETYFGLGDPGAKR